MYSMIEFKSHYSEAAWCLWFYSKDDATSFNADIANTHNFKSFKYNAIIIQ